MGKHPIDVHVGYRLRLFRLQADLSQTELAERVGVTFQQVQKYEKGVNRISASRLFEFSQILNVAVQDFFDGVADVAASSSEAQRSTLASRLDHEIFRLTSQLGDAIVKRRIRDLLASLAASEANTSRKAR